MKIRLRSLFVLAIICLFVPLCFASRQISANSFKTLEKIAISKGHQYGNQHVLITFDLDLTLLALDQPLGSAAWYAWQSKLLKHDPQSPELVAHSVSHLLKIQGFLFSLSHMHPVESDTPAIINHLQKLGFKTIVLTDRGPGYRIATERHLRENHLWFANSALAPKLGSPDRYIPYPGARPIEYINGLALTEGNNKGIILQDLLKKTSDHIKAVVSIDDTPHEIQDIYQAIQPTDIDITAIHYTRSAPLEKRLDSKTAQDKVTRQWQEFRSLSHKIFAHEQL